MAVPFEMLRDSDPLTVDEIYLGGTRGRTSDDPIDPLLHVGNQGGFRYRGSPRDRTVRLVALYTSLADEDWPDTLDTATGIFTYYGDNKRPGSELHATQRGGNLILRDAFEATHGSSDQRASVPPFLLFSRSGDRGRAVQFRGLLAPGADVVPPGDDLVAIWRSKAGQRFQNYKASFTVLNVATVQRHWIDNMLDGRPLDGAPEPWRAWVAARAYHALRAQPVRLHRSPREQQPRSEADRALLRQLHGYFRDRPHDFERCAVELFRLTAADPRHDIELTRPSRDGGRDAIGTYAIGPTADPIRITFALEAKCYDPAANSVGVKEMSRLISRIKHREFGVFVTTSWVAEQAYKEVREDGHNIAIMSGADIVEVLKASGRGTSDALIAWLEAEFP